MSIKCEIEIFNYKISKKSFDEIEKLIVLRNCLPPNIDLFHSIPLTISLNEAVIESKKFMKSNFKIHPINCLKDCKEIESNSNDVNLEISKSITDPYKIPIEKTNEERSSIEITIIKQENQYPKLYYNSIKINKNITDITSSTITHEITHTQQNSVAGVLNYYTNIETLPILLELVNYLEKSPNSERTTFRRLKYLIKYIDLLDQIIYKKLLEVLKNKNSSKDFDENMIALCTYIESTLKALNLFDLYEHSNNNIRKEMLNYLQNIFDANRSVEDFLEYYDTTFESSVDFLQKKVKQIKLP